MPPGGERPSPHSAGRDARRITYRPRFAQPASAIADPRTGGRKAVLKVRVSPNAEVGGREVGGLYRGPGFPTRPCRDAQRGDIEPWFGVASLRIGNKAGLENPAHGTG